MNEISRTSDDRAEFYSIDAEQILLGSILDDNDALHSIPDDLAPAMFYDPVHAEIFRIAGDRIRKGHKADPITLQTVLENHPGLADLGGSRYLVRLVSLASSYAVKDYANVIVETARKRAITLAIREGMAGLRDGKDSNDIVSEIMARFTALPAPAGRESTVSLTSAMHRAIEKAARSYSGEEVYLKTGIRALDSIVKGWGVGDYVLLGGPTSSGKTSLAIEIAANVASREIVEDGKPRRLAVGFWSLEMEDDEIANRFASRTSSVPYSDIRSAGQMEEKTFRRWINGARSAADLNLRIIPKHVRDIAGGYAAFQKVKAELGGRIDLAVVDYAQLVRAPGRERTQQMVEVSLGLKFLGRLLGCPVLALVQIDRQLGKRDDRRPQLTDIRETGQFENDADFAIFCHRESYWLERDGPEVGKDGNVSPTAQGDWESALSASRNVVEVLVRKNRHGPLGTAKVGLHLPTNRFWDLDGSRRDEAKKLEGFA